MPNAKQSGKSPYQKYGKVPYTYTFGKCQHNHTHVENAIGGPYEMCDACGTIRRNLSQKQGTVDAALKLAA